MVTQLTSVIQNLFSLQNWVLHVCCGVDFSQKPILYTVHVIACSKQRCDHCDLIPCSVQLCMYYGYKWCQGQNFQHIIYSKKKKYVKSFLLFVIQCWMLKICDSIQYYLIRDNQEAKLLNIWYVLICVYVIEYNGQCPQQNSVELWTPRGELLISQ